MTASYTALAGSVRDIPLHLINPNPFQPRQHFDAALLRDLAANIALVGLLQPLVVRPDPDAPERFQLVAGERRLRAARLIPLETVPATVREVNDTDTALLSLTENEQRENITDLDRAKALENLAHRLEAAGETPSLRNLAARVRQDKNWVSARLRLLGFSPDVQEMLGRNFGVLTVAKEINAVKSPDRRAAYIALVNAGRSRGDVLDVMEEHKRADEVLAAKLKAIREAQTPPDKETAAAQREAARSGSATTGKGGGMVTNNNAAQAVIEIEDAFRKLATWAPYVDAEPLAERLEEFGRRLLRGDLSR